MTIRRAGDKGYPIHGAAGIGPDDRENAGCFLSCDGMIAGHFLIFLIEV